MFNRINGKAALMNDAGNLESLTELAGIEPDYWDIWGNYHPVSAESKRSLLRALGIRAENDTAITASIRKLEEDPWRHPLPPVAVVREGGPAGFPVTLPADDADVAIACEVIDENGARHEFSFRPADAAPSKTRVIDGRVLHRRIVDIPVTLPLGYHTLRLAAVSDETMQLIVAPKRCYLPQVIADGGKTWGVTAHLYTLRSERNWGIGDFTDLADMATLLGAAGADFVGVNPLHALFIANPEHCSPFSPSNRRFLNPLYIAVDRLPEFEPDDVDDGALAAARATGLVDYPAVAALKLSALRSCWTRARPDAVALARFRAEGGAGLERHAPHPRTEHLGLRRHIGPEGCDRPDISEIPW